MPHRLKAAPVALILLSGAALAQDDPRTVGVSVAGTVVEVPVEVAAEACGIDAGTLLAEWEGMGADISTMARTSVTADATDLSPEVAADTPMDATRDGVTVADGADATADAGGEEAPDVASDGVTGSQGDVGGVAADAGAGAAAGAAAGEDEAAGMATPTEGTALAKAAVCEVGQATADELGIVAGG